jgi:RNA polymerase sigma factor (sigma-70 family)
VYGTALRRLHDPSLAHEVTQNVFIFLAKRAPFLAAHPSVGGWLYRTTVHFAQHESRREQRRRTREQLANELGTCMKPDDSLLTQLEPVLDEAMLELRSADREALVLRFFGNRSIREVAVALGIREDAAQKRIAKALDILTEGFRRRGFRVAGAAIVATALQQAAANAVPSGLALAVTNSVIAAGVKASLPNLAIPIIKIMSLTKIQTAVICVVIAALPLGYQWHRIAKAIEERAQLNRNIKALRTNVLAVEGDKLRAERQFRRLQTTVAAKPSTLGSAFLKSGGLRPAQNLYAWDENSPYVRIPRQVLSQVRFAPFAARVAGDGKVERFQLPVLAADGTPQPTLETALGLSPEEAERLRLLCQTQFAEFNQLASGHSVLKEEPFAGSSTAVKLHTDAFPEDGAKFRDQFKEQLASALGPDRAEAFWQQATPMFDELFNDFGAYVRELQLIRNPNGNLELLNSRPGHSTSIGLLAGRNGMPLPPSLQAYADTWAR